MFKSTAPGSLLRSDARHDFGGLTHDARHDLARLPAAGGSRSVKKDLNHLFARR